jgi:putative endonuclease
VWPSRRGRIGGPTALPGSRRPLTGQQGERLAERHLRRAGYRILARNYRCPAGEADLIALDRRASGAVVFVEVKTRSSDRFVDPESAVDARKRRQLLKVAQFYLAGHDPGDRPVRFDVVAVVGSAKGRPQVRHIVNAFTPA